YIQSSAPTGSGVATGRPSELCSVPPLLATATMPAAKTITRAAAAATIGAYFFLCICTGTSQVDWRACALTPPRRSRLLVASPPEVRTAAGSEYTRYRIANGCDGE